MAKIFITGSSDGLGQLLAGALVDKGHEVVLHARNSQRARYAREKLPQASEVLVGDLADLQETVEVAAAANRFGAFDAVIHNAGVYRALSRELLAVNSLAPYVLTSLMKRPQRLIYLSSGMHLQGQAKLEYFREGMNRISYSDTKLHILLLAMAVARKWPGIFSNAVDPGWVPTKMGGPGAPDDLHQGFETQQWLATSEEAAARVSGRYFFHRKERSFNPAGSDVSLQEAFLKSCATMTGVLFPA